MSREFRGRPIYERSYPGAWLVLLAPLLIGVDTLLGSVSVSLLPPSAAFARDLGMVNFEVYYYTTAELLAGGDVYAVSPPGRSDFYQYLYPPVTIFVFLPFLAVGPATAYVAFLGLNALAAIAFTVLIVRFVESLGRPLGWVDVGLLFCNVIAGTHLITNYVFGNVNLFLGLGVAVAIYLLETGPATARRQSLAGAALAVVALFKVFPALIGLYLLRIRAWWAVAAATATGIGGLVLGELAFAAGSALGWQAGDRAYGFGITERWLEQAVLPRSDTDAFVGGYPADEFYYVTIQRPLSHVIWGIWDGAPPWLLVVGSFAIGLAIAGASLYQMDTRTDRLVGVFAVVAVAVFVVPSLRFYLALLFLPLFALAYVLEGHPGQPAFVAGAAIAAYTDYPADVAEVIQPLPGPVVTLLEPVVTTTSNQLLGVAVLLLALAILSRRRGDGGVQHSSIPAAARECRPTGVPLRTWLAERAASWKDS